MEGATFIDPLFLCGDTLWPIAYSLLTLKRCIPPCRVHARKSLGGPSDRTKAAGVAPRIQQKYGSKKGSIAIPP